MKKTKQIRVILITTFLFLLYMCLGTVVGKAAGSSGIVLDKTSVVIIVGNHERIAVTGATGAISWSSSNPSVASVDSSGVVTSVTLGTTVITATEGSDTSTCTVTVIPNYAFPLDGASTQTFNGGTTDIEYVTKFISMTQALNVTVDGIELDPIHYTMTNNSMGTVVTLKSFWLQTQANKSYNIVTHFIQGYSTFTLVVNQPILSSSTSYGGTSSNSTPSSSTFSGGTSSNSTSSSGTSPSSTASHGTFSSATTNSQSAAKNPSSTSQGGENPTSTPTSSTISPDNRNYNPVTGGDDTAA